MLGLIVNLLIVVLVAAIVYWILSIIPMDARVRNVILAILLLLLVLWLFSLLGVFGPGHRLFRGGGGL